jgi:branched-chain amino acid transport system permease protein
MTLLEYVLAGLALGGVYSLMALGFVVVYRATGVINLAGGGFVLLGPYFIYLFHVSASLPFVWAMVAAIVMVAMIAALIGLTIVTRMVGAPTFSVVMVTVGFLYVIKQIASAIWGDSVRFLGDPWGSKTTNVMGVRVLDADIWTFAVALAAFAVLAMFFQYSTFGVAMRASSKDPIAAAAQGISTRRVVIQAWGIAGALAGLAGVMYASGVNGVSPEMSVIAFAALPAMVFGGMDSVLGAVVGGMLLGVAQVISAGYAGSLAPYLGQNFYTIIPFVGMLLVLAVRPRGLFGSVEVERI